MSAEALLIAALAFLAWFWWEGLQKRELALAAARLVCERSGVQFLDASVALRRLRLRRDSDQRARFYREYSFDYSTMGEDRHAGRVWLLGARVVDVQLARVEVVVNPAPASDYGQHNVIAFQRPYRGMSAPRPPQQPEPDQDHGQG
jgi:hypothetical protein